MSTTLSSLSEQTHSGREQIKHARFGLSAFSSQPQVWALVVLAEPIAPIELRPLCARVFGGFDNPSRSEQRDSVHV
jgi:hypothetical protein